MVPQFEPFPAEDRLNFCQIPEFQRKQVAASERRLHLHIAYIMQLIVPQSKKLTNFKVTNATTVEVKYLFAT